VPELFTGYPPVGAVAVLSLKMIRLAPSSCAKLRNHACYE
jgi:hypothetical protein